MLASKSPFEQQFYITIKIHLPCVLNNLRNTALPRLSVISHQSSVIKLLMLFCLLIVPLSKMKAQCTGATVYGAPNTISYLPTSALPSSFKLRGEVHVGSWQYVALYNKQIAMDTDASIVIESNATLDLDNGTAIFGCTNMWNGITVKGSGKIYVWGNASISDAENAIKTEPNAIISCYKGIFSGNYIGINIDAATSHSVDMTVIATNFKGIGIPGTATLKPPRNGTLSYAGIQINNLASGEIGYTYSSFPFANNLFNNGLTHGIKVTNSNLIVRKSDFTKFILTGIFCTDSYLKQVGNGALAQDSPSFYQTNGATAIGIVNSACDISYNNIQGIFFGVYVGNATPTLPQIVIAHNNFLDIFYHAIDIQYGTFADIAYNEFSNIGTGVGTGISTYLGQIRSNKFNVSKSNSRGIAISGYGHFITDNIITNSNTYCTAIDCNSAANTSVVNNVVINGQSTPNNSKGITLFNCQNFNVSCNNISNNFSFGLDILGDNSGTTIKSNLFKNNSIGLYYRNTATIGTQPHHGNLWQGTFTVAAAKNEATTPNVILSQQYTVNSASNSQLMPNPIMSPAGQWFLPQTGTTFSCTIPTGLTTEIAVEERGGNDGDGENLDIAIAEDNLIYGTYTKEIQWVTKKNLYRRLLEKKQNGKAIHQKLDAFLSKNALNNIKLFNDVYAELNNIAILTQSDKDELNVHHQRILDNKAELSKLYTTNSTKEINKNTDLDKSILAVLKKSENPTEKRTKIVERLKAHRQKKLTALQAKVAKITSESKVEELEKNTLSLYLNYQTNDNSLSEAEWVAVKSIADKCVNENSFAIYLARELYNYHQITDFRANDVCTVQTRSENDEQPIDNNGSLTVAPNPTKTNVTVSITIKEGKKYNLFVTDVFGNTLRKYQPESPTLTVDINNMLSGMYFIHLLEDNVKISTQKLLIQH